MVSSPGATANDIPWLEIEVVEHRNEGILSDATSVQRKVYGPGVDGTEVQLITINGGGHTWPGRPSPDNVKSLALRRY